VARGIGKADGVYATYATYAVGYPFSPPRATSEHNAGFVWTKSIKTSWTATSKFLSEPENSHRTYV